jgi:hypothetical protein
MQRLELEAMTMNKMNILFYERPVFGLICSYELIMEVGSSWV